MLFPRVRIRAIPTPPGSRRIYKIVDLTTYDKLLSLLEAMQDHSSEWRFAYPLSKTYHPNYYDVVKKPHGLLYCRDQAESR